MKPLPCLLFGLAVALAGPGRLVAVEEPGVVRLSALYVDEAALPAKYPIYNLWEVRTAPKPKRKPVPTVPKEFADAGIFVNVTMFYVVDSTGTVVFTQPFTVQLLKADTRSPIDRAFIDKLIAAGSLTPDNRRKSLDEVRLEIGRIYIRQLVEAVKRWTFTPGFKDGRSVAVRMMLTGQQMWSQP